MLFPFVEAYFETDWMRDPRVEIIAEDGRNFLRHTAATYDIISLELGEVSRPGVAFFYTVDFYARVRERLTSGGYLVQFVPLRFLKEDQFRGVVRSFLTVFPQSILWYNTSELLLIGSVDDAFNIAEGRLLGVDEEVQADLQYSHWGGVSYYLNQPHVFWGGYLMGAEGLASATVEADVYWDDRPVLDYETVQNAESDELAFAEMLYKYRGSIDALMPGEVDARIAEVQNKNLREIAARVFVREASDLTPARAHETYCNALCRGDSPASRVSGCASHVRGCDDATGAFAGCRKTLCAGFGTRSRRCSRAEWPRCGVSPLGTA